GPRQPDDDSPPCPGSPRSLLRGMGMSGEYPAKPGEGSGLPSFVTLPRARGPREACFAGWGCWGRTRRSRGRGPGLLSFHSGVRCMIARTMRVLVVEDERDLADAVVRGLSRQGFAVDLAEDGAQALDKTWVSSYDVIVLDRDLPAVH